MASTLLSAVIVAMTLIAPSVSFAGVWSPDLAAENFAPSPGPIEIADCNAEDLFREGRLLKEQGRLSDAVTATRRALRCAEEVFGADHVNTAFILNDLAVEHLALKELDRALRYSRRAVSIMGAAHPDSPDHARLIMTLAAIHGRMGSYLDAEPLYRDAYDIAHGPSVDDPALQAAAARSLAMALGQLSRHEESRERLQEAAGLIEAKEGDQSSAYGQALLDLAGAHLLLDEPEDAMRLATRAKTLIGDGQRADIVMARAAISRSSLDEAATILGDILEGGADDDLITAQAHYYSAFIQILRGRFVEAEEALQHALTSFRTILGNQHPMIARCQHSLAIVYNRLRRYDDAEDLYRQAIRTNEETLGAESIAVADTRKEYAHLLMERGDLGAAEAEARSALTIYQASPEARSHSLGLAHSSLGFVLHEKGDLDGAAAAFEEGLALIEAARGPTSSDLPPGLLELGLIRLAQNRPTDAGPYLEKAVSIRKRDAAMTPWGLAKALSALSRLRAAQGRPRDALNDIERAVDIIEARLLRPERAHTDLYEGETQSERGIFELYLKIAHGQRSEEPDALASRMFEVAQLPNLTQTSSAIARLSFRLAGGGDGLGRLLRRRQDTIEDWQALNAQLSERLAKGGSAQHEQSLRTELQSLDRRIEDLDGQLAEAFPEHTALTRAKAVPADEVRSLLQPREAVLIQVTGEAETHLLLLTPDRLEVRETALGKDELERSVQSLRRGVDLDQEGVTGLEAFDVVSAHRLYQALFAPFENSLAEVDHLMAIFDHGMEQLPPSLLLRSKAPIGDYGRFRDDPSDEAFDAFGELDYLARHLTVSTLPSVGALKALRQRFHAPTRRRPFAGFGNPAFAGKSLETNGAMPDNRLRSEDLPSRRIASRNFDPLPASEAELLELAFMLDADRGDLFLGVNANETALKRADLMAYRMIAFGTHVIIPGEVNAEVDEPALLLPVSDANSTDDDGFLTESEIVRLRLGADLVLLTACSKSAPPERPGAEALSELARAFLLAGAKSLLVSHWGGERKAMMALTATTLAHLQNRPDEGRAAALGKAMTMMIDHPPEARYSHPAFWASFAIIGEGLQ